MHRSWRARLEASLRAAWARDGAWAHALAPLAALHAALRPRLAPPPAPASALVGGRPTLVVGNRVVGGAGKTPTTLALVGWLQAQGWRPGIVSRGHGRRRADRILGVDPAAPADQVGDEPLLLRLRSGVPVWVGRDRVAAAQALLAAHPEVNALVADDGLQHRRLARTLEVVVQDERGLGNGRLLPAGPLREPDGTPSVAARGALRLQVGPGPGGAPAQALRRLGPPVGLDAWWRGESGPPEAWAMLRALPQPPSALAGVAVPERFFAALAAQGLEGPRLALADHAGFASLPWPVGTAHLLVTEKDAVKLRPARCAAERPGTQVWVVPLDLEIDPGFWVALAARWPALPPR